MLRVGVVGARRSRQGIGEYVARELHRAGARVVAVAGSSEAGAAEAARALEARYGIEGARPYAGAEALISGERAREGLDALAICSPNATHEAALAAALEAGLHVLCDKPLLWDPARDGTARARTLAEGLRARGKALVVTAQWPDTLAAFRALYPGSRAGLEGAPPPRTLAMRLSPFSPGTGGVLDCLWHPISLARALAGSGEARLAALRRAGEDGFVLEWTWRHARGVVACELSARRKTEQPRPAAYAIDGRAAARVLLPGYAMALEGSEGRRVPLEDPLALRVRAFLDAAARGVPADVEGIACEQAAFESLARAIGAGAPPGA